QPDRPRVYQRERHHRLLAEHEHIKRIIVFGQCLRNEAIIRRIIDSGIEHSVQLDQSALLVELVLHTRSKRYLDESVELTRQSFAGGYVMPGMDHEIKVLGARFRVQGDRLNQISS